MLYWIIMIVLALGCAGMLAGTFISIKNRKSESAQARRRGRRQTDQDYDAEEEHNGARRRTARQPVPPRDELEEKPRRKKKRQWKIILEDIDSWEKCSFVFYDTVGLGRDRDVKMYEK